MINTKEIKMNFKKETKRCMMPKTYTEFKQIISKCYGISEKEINNLLTSYTDDEEDKVLITSDFDFEQAIIFMEKQKINILRINIDVENSELAAKTEKIIQNIYTERSVKSSNFIIEESKESPKDFNNKTISTIAIESDRNLNNLNENNAILEKIESISIVGNDKIELNIKENTGKIDVENWNKISEDLRSFIITPITTNSKCKKNKNIKNDNGIDTDLLLKFGNELKGSIDKMLNEKFSKIKEKIADKTMKKSLKLMEKILSKKKTSKQDMESEIPLENAAIHDCVTCDDCGVSPIIGKRYKCAVCNNFDFCSKCEEKNKDSHPHPFILIRNNDRAPHSISCIVKDNCQIIQKIIPFNKDYKLADVFINNSIIAEVNELSSKCLTDNLSILVTDESKEIIKTLKLKNIGTKNWPKPVYLTCVAESSTIAGTSVPIKIKVESGKENNVEIKINSKDLKSGDYISVWQLQNEKKESFGERVTLNVKIVRPEEVVDCQENKSIYDSFVFQCQVDELKSAYNLKAFDDKTIKKAVVDAKGDVDMTFQILNKRKIEK